ncbi:hypothetical protein J6590_054320 [Homalodisca vitripennis]|nr:hypothetical protein J6590_054320 [Homalodisca vitripennis]
MNTRRLASVVTEEPTNYRKSVVGGGGGRTMAGLVAVSRVSRVSRAERLCKPNPAGDHLITACLRAKTVPSPPFPSSTPTTRHH